MAGIPIAAAGPLVRDNVYLEDSEAGVKYFIGSRGGGAQWNALVNASLNGATAKALCVGGADEAARLCIGDLRTAGVETLRERTRRGKRTRTLHEVLDLKSVRLNNPRHKFVVRCPVCGSETYRRGSAGLTRKIMNDDFARLLRNLAEDGVLIHTDGLDKTRLEILKSLKHRQCLISLDLGRSTGLQRMRQEAVLDRLRTVDILFVHSRVWPELRRMVGVSSHKELVSRLGISILVTTLGSKGAHLCWKRNVGITCVEQPTPRATRLIDSTGAGDALIGYMLAKIAEQPPKELEGALEDTDHLAGVLQEAQKWAAKKCGFVGARGHVAGPDGNTWSWETASEFPKASGTHHELQLTNLTRNSCIACESSLDDVSQALVSTVRFRQNVLTLPSKVEKAWQSRHLSSWKVLTSLDGPGYVVGTGGSFVSATFISLLLSQYYRSSVQTTRPFDFVRLGVPTPWAIFVSNSGRTPDIQRAVERAMELTIPRVIVVTGARPDELTLPLREERDLVLVTGADGERGFLSVAGVVVPCFLTWAALSVDTWSDNNAYREFHRIYEMARRKVAKAFAELERKVPGGFAGKRTLVLGGGFAWPAMLNLESKMIEGGLGHPEVSEIKDYSHGRFVSSIDQGHVVIVCGLPDDEPYRRFMVKRMREKNQIVELTSEKEGGEGALELLLQSEHLMRTCAETVGMDPSKPRIPPIGLELYRYADILSYREKK